MTEFLYGEWANGSNCPIAEATGETGYDSLSPENLMAGFYDKHVQELIEDDEPKVGTVDEETAREAWFSAIRAVEKGAKDMGDNTILEDAAEVGHEVAETLGWS